MSSLRKDLRSTGGKGGVRQVLSKRIDIIFEKIAPEILAHVVSSGEIVSVAADLRLAVTSMGSRLV
jgi:hypothetical protein